VAGCAADQEAGIHRGEFPAKAGGLMRLIVAPAAGSAALRAANHNHLLPIVAACTFQDRHVQSTRKDIMTAAAVPTEPTQQSSIWWLFLLQGIAAIALGLLLITNPGATLVVLMTFLGFYWLIEGILSLVHVFVDRFVPWVWSLLIGLVGIAAGILVLRHPLLAALTVPTVLVIILGVQGLVMGVLEIIGGFSGGGVGSFILGVINVLIGLILLASPVAAAVAAPLVFGILLLIEGVGLVIWAFRVRA